MYCCCSTAKSCLTLSTPWTEACQAPLSYTISGNLLKFSQWCYLAISSSATQFSFCLQSFPVFSNEPAFNIRWPKYWSFGCSHSPSNEYSGLISFRIDSFGLLAGQGTLESSLAPQFESIKFLIEGANSLLYGPTLTSMYDHWRNHSFDYVDLCWQSSVSAFYMLSQSIIAFLPSSRHLLISWLQSLTTVILEPKKIKSVTVYIVSPSICPRNDGTRCCDLSYLNVGFKVSFFTLLFHPHQEAL